MRQVTEGDKKERCHCSSFLTSHWRSSASRYPSPMACSQVQLTTALLTSLLTQWATSSRARDGWVEKIKANAGGLGPDRRRVGVHYTSVKHRWVSWDIHLGNSNHLLCCHSFSVNCCTFSFIVQLSYILAYKSKNVDVGRQIRRGGRGSHRYICEHRLPTDAERAKRAACLKYATEEQYLPGT